MLFNKQNISNKIISFIVVSAEYGMENWHGPVYGMMEKEYYFL
jgi:hypothetical protein